MKLTKCWFWGLIFLLGFGLISNALTDEKTKAAERAAIDWLALIDTTQYEKSWDEASSLFRSQVSLSDWLKAITAARNPLGSHVARKLLSATYSTNLPGAPDGEYVVLQFQTIFKNKARAVETVTPMLDGGQWKVSGYYVR